MFVAKGERSDEHITFHYIGEVKRTPYHAAAFAVMINISSLINISIWYTNYGIRELCNYRDEFRDRLRNITSHRYPLDSFASKCTQERDSKMSFIEAERWCYFSLRVIPYGMLHDILKFEDRTNRDLLFFAFGVYSTFWFQSTNTSQNCGSTSLGIAAYSQLCIGHRRTKKRKGQQ